MTVFGQLKSIERAIYLSSIISLNFTKCHQIINGLSINELILAKYQ